MKKSLSLALSGFALLALSFSALAADDKPQQLTATEILNKHLEAIGGRQALAHIKTRVAIGTVKKESETEARMAIMSEAPNRVSAIYVFQEFTLQMTFDGKVATLRPMLSSRARQVGALVDKYNEVTSSGFMFNSISLYSLLGAGETNDVKFTAKGMKKIKGRQAYVVEVRRRSEPSVRLFFDAEDFMWTRTEFGRVQVSKQQGGFTNDVVARGEDEAPVDFYFETSDFRSVDGVKLPFKFVQSISSPFLKEKTAGIITGTISEYRHNINIEPKMFQ